MVFPIFQLILIVFLPYLLTLLTKRLGTENWLSPVVLSYLAGIGLCNLTNFPLSNSISTKVSEISIILAIPLLLYSTDLLSWLKLAKKTLLAFGLVSASVIISTSVVGWFFKDSIPHTWMLSGMLAGVFIGGTPNMNAIGIALEAGEETFISLNAAEIVCGGTYLIFLTTVAHQFFGWFLPDFEGDKHNVTDEFLPKIKFRWRDILKAFLLTLLLGGAAAGITILLMGTMGKPGFIILLISSFSVLASFSPRVRNLSGAYETGEYLLLMFCIAIGMLADIRVIIHSGGMLLAFSSIVLLSAAFLNVVFCRIFNIDRDTMIITSTAAFYGPPFIGQIAAVIKNRSLVFSGIATGLVGLAIANFIGVAIANLLHVLFGG
ncbi:MAG: DUF819 family protein [Saprospiraceae bacterium]|nr:MAG: DUF819 family protein [Saprospiraceae bacterium]